MDKGETLLEQSHEITCEGCTELAMECREEGPALLRWLTGPEPEGAIRPDTEAYLRGASLVCFGVGVKSFRRLCGALLEVARDREGLGAVADAFASAPESL